MTFQISSRHRAALRCAPKAAVLLLPVLAAASVLWFGTDALDAKRARLDELTATTARMRATIAILEADNSGHAARGGPELSGDFFVASQDAIISADLHGSLRKLAMAHAVDLNSANALPVRQIDQVDYVGIRAMMRGQLADIQRVLHAVEANKPLLFVERLTLRVDTWPIKSADPSVDGASAIVAEVDVFGAKPPSEGTPPQQPLSPLPEISSAKPAPAVPMARTRGGRAS